MKFYQASIVVALLLSSTQAIQIRQFEKPSEPVSPPRPTQAGWNTQANASKKPGNESKCNPSKCGAYSITSDRACCHAGDDVPAENKMPVYPFPKPKKEEKKSLAQIQDAEEKKKSPHALPPRPTQAGWNTQANAGKKPGNESKCNPSKCGAYSLTSDRACCHAGDVVPKNNQMPAYPFVAPAAPPALSQITGDALAPPKPTQAGWNTQANAGKNPGNESKCNPSKCGAYSITSDRACCHAGDDVPAENKMPAYPFPKPKKEEKKK